MYPANAARAIACAHRAGSTFTLPNRADGPLVNDVDVGTIVRMRTAGKGGPIMRRKAI